MVARTKMSATSTMHIRAPAGREIPMKNLHGMHSNQPIVCLQAPSTNRVRDWGSLRGGYKHVVYKSIARYLDNPKLSALFAGPYDKWWLPSTSHSTITGCPQANVSNFSHLVYRAWSRRNPMHNLLHVCLQHFNRALSNLPLLILMVFPSWNQNVEDNYRL